MKKIKNVMLTVTEKCNLNCLYCFEGNKRFRSMKFDTAIRTIENEMNEENEYEEILFDFMGGEPFAEFELIREICEYTWSKEWNKRYLFFASTNGTLVHGEIQKWLEQHKEDFICGISLDGLPEVHNHNRSNSYYEIDINFFLRLWPLQEAKMTIYPDNLDKLAESIIYLHDLGFRVKSNLAYGPNWNSKSKLEEYEVALNRLCDFYLLNLDVEPSTIINMDLIPIAYPSEPIHKWCGMGGQMVAYDIDGKKYPCHFFQDMTSGKINYEELIKTDFDNIQNSLSEKCRNCILRNTCSTCYGYNYSNTGDFGKKENGLCMFKKVSAIATSTLTYRRLNIEYNGDFSDISFDAKQKLLAVKIIQNAAQNNNWEI